MTTERLTDEALVEKLRKRANQIGKLLSDPPKDAPDAVLMREAADALPDLKLLDPADDEALNWIETHLSAIRRDNGNMDYSMKGVVRAFQAGKAAATPADDLRAALPPMPETDDRRLWDDAEPWGYLESDRDWAHRNDAVVPWLADNHVAIRAALSQPAAAPQPADDLWAALEAAERFISGFEGDEAQDGIADLLSKIRAALAKIA